jgi:hypothetical protein
MIFPPEDPVPKNITLQRWLRSWISNQKSINFSGLCTEMVCQLIKERDPEYYERYKHLLEENPIKRKDQIREIISKTNVH